MKKLLKTHTPQEEYEMNKKKYPKYAIYFSDDDFLYAYNDFQKEEVKSLIFCFPEKLIIKETNITKVILNIENIEALINHCNGHLFITRNLFNDKTKHYKYYVKPNFYRSSIKYRDANTLERYLKTHKIKIEDLK